MLFLRFCLIFSLSLGMTFSAPKKKKKSAPPPKVIKLDHAGIITSMDDKAYKAGEVIYKGLCVNCHGADGKTAPLPTARAFGGQSFKFGSDPYSIFQTLTKGNGLMGPMLHLTPLERYQVTHYIIEKYVVPFNNGHQVLSDDYLNGLPKGTDMGTGEEVKDRDFGPGLASQLGRNISSVMNLKLKGLSLSYNLHNMNQAQIWDGGYLNIKNTQHIKLRGEGIVEPEGKPIVGLQGWQWAHEGTFDYPKEKLLARGPMPANWMEYKGHYLHNNNLIFSYSIDQRDILEMPKAVNGIRAVVHHFEIQAGKALKLAVAELEKDSNFKSQVEGSSSSIRNSNDFTAAKVFGDTQGLSWETSEQGKLVLNILASDKKKIFKVLRYTAQGQEAEQGFNELTTLISQTPVIDLDSKTKGGEQRWAEVLETKGKVSNENQAYVLDTITLPASNPWNTWFRTSALDFFEDGRMALATHGGDVWIVSGIDDKLNNLKWKRYAAGLYEPFGIRVVEGKVYVTCKDRLTRLHDYNNDGEADFYESFYSDEDVSTFFHAYNFDLQTDEEGNFYYAKAGQYTDYKLPGSVVKIPPEGGRAEIHCTGFRTPNGMGITKDGLISVSDNEGNWMPASKVSLTKPGGFYGYVQTKATNNWKPDGGKIDITKVIPPKTYDQPLMWIPKYVDNSSGGQLWVEDERWGPLSGRFLHTSFGKGHLYYFLIQDAGDIHQAALVRLPHDFDTGIMRARVNPNDGQVYATGLNGWNARGRKGLTEGGVQRLRYTGKTLNMIDNWNISKGKMEISFNFDLAEDMSENEFALEQWNYRWEQSYGSKEYKLSDGEPGRDTLNLDNVILDSSKRKLTFMISSLQAVDQVEMKMKVKKADGSIFEEDLWMTIHRTNTKMASK